MRQIIVIGVGAGHPDQVTVQAVEALNRTDVFFVVDKGTAKDDLLAARTEILRRHVQKSRAYQVAQIQDPPRDRSAADYRPAVAEWHALRAERFAEVITDHLDPSGGVGAFLVWGDPALYDSTLRVIDVILERHPGLFTYTVVPGVSSVHALTSAHRIPLNRIGEPIHITTGRRLADGIPDGLDSVVVMLDAGFAAANLPDPDLEIFWGAYLSTDDEVLISGRLGDVAGQISSTKNELRERHGWIMDTYLVRRAR